MRPPNVLLALLAFLLAFPTKAQNYIYTVAGSGNIGWGPLNGGLAIEAELGDPRDIAVDLAGNIYMWDAGIFWPHFRRVNAANGIIDSIPGPITDYREIELDSASNIYALHFTGGLIRKIEANTYYTSYLTTIIGAHDMCVDKFANVYASTNNAIVRRDAQTNILDTICSASSNVYSLCGDQQGNIYYRDSNKIKRISAGTFNVTTFAGTGNVGNSGDGGVATNATFSNIGSVVCDYAGNVYVADDERIRKIDVNTGIITAYAGIPGSTNTSEGAPALLSSLDGTPSSMSVDIYGNLYYTTSVGAPFRLIRKITGIPPSFQFSSTGFSVSVYNQCNSTNFIVNVPTYNSNYNLRTVYNDGTQDEYGFTTNTGNSGFLYFNHAFPLSGQYNVKHILLNGNIAIDSIEYDYDYHSCHSISVNYYRDNDNNCIYNSQIDEPISQPLLVRVDSNSVPVDTLSCTSGLVYNSFGDPGDVYTLNVIDHPPGLQATCPVFASTINSLVYIDTQKVVMQCTTNSGFDVGVIATQQTRANQSETDIVVNNSYCNESNCQLTMTFSPKYTFNNATPQPTSQTGNTITWDLDVNSFANNFAYLHVNLDYNTNILTVGDTVNTRFELTPIIGDVDPTNNTIIRHDTVTGPFDPNAVYVNPTGCVEIGDELEYTITFENMGNDTAHHIYVMDTLSADVNMSSFRLLAASHLMNVTKVSNNGYNILKFEFPNIDLPDSSSPYRHGMVMYTIKTADIWPPWQLVTNKAGIYFDYMPAVLTNVAETYNCIPASVQTVSSKNNQIQIYPNPALDEIVVKADIRSGNYTITNSLGQTLSKGPITTNETKITVGSLSTGIYYITVRGNNGTRTNKFIKI